MDPYFNLDKVEINFNQFHFPFKHYFIYKEEKQKKCCAQVIIERQLESYMSVDYILNFEKLCNSLTQGDNLENELKNCKVMALSPLMLKLRCFVNERKNLLLCLNQYFREEISFLEEFTLCAKVWKDAYLLLMKSISRNYNKRIIEKGAESLLNAIHMEKKLIAKLKKLVSVKRPFVNL